MAKIEVIRAERWTRTHGYAYLDCNLEAQDFLVTVFLEKGEYKLPILPYGINISEESKKRIVEYAKRTLENTIPITEQ